GKQFFVRQLRAPRRHPEHFRPGPRQPTRVPLQLHGGETMKSKPWKDPFHCNEEQVPAHVLPPPPPDLESIDDDAARSRVNPRPTVLTEEGFKHAYKREPEHTKEYDFGKRKK